jgi:hypothetical protein
MMHTKQGCVYLMMMLERKKPKVVTDILSFQIRKQNRIITANILKMFLLPEWINDKRMNLERMRKIMLDFHLCQNVDIFNKRVN